MKIRKRFVAYSDFCSISIRLKMYFFFSFLLFSSSVFAQKKQIRFEHLTVNDGLSQNWVSTIYQDSYGYMWFGTGGNGLNKFDAYKFSVYKNYPKDENSLSDNWIERICEDKRNNLWIATAKGLNKFNRDYNNFIRIKGLQNHHCIKIVESSKGEIYVLSLRKLFKVTGENDTVETLLDSVPGYNRINFTDFIYDETHDNFWITSNKGLFRFDNELKKFSIYLNDPANPNSISDDKLRCIISDTENRIWIGTIDNGISLVQFSDKDRSEPSFINYIPDPSDPNSINLGAVMTLLDDGDGKLWIGLENGGLDIINKNSVFNGKPVFDHYTHNKFDNTSLSNNSVHSLYKDYQGTIWVGIFGSGLSYYNELFHNFRQYKNIPNKENSLVSNHVNSILKENDDIWLGTEGGISILNRKTGLFKNFVHNYQDSKTIGANSIWIVFKDSRNNIWAGGWGSALNLYNRKSKNFTRFMHDANNPNSLGSNYVFDITEDKEGILTVGCMNQGGINRINYDNGLFKNDRLTSNSGLSGNSIQTILESSNGELWVSTTLGVDLMDKKTGKVVSFYHDQADSTSITYNGAAVIFEDSRKNIWIGTVAGLNYFVRKDSSFVCYTEVDGLPNNNIKSICEDNHGNLWISSGNGLTKFIDGISKPSDPVFENFCVENGLVGTEFVHRSSFKDEDGYLYFGSTEGLNIFHPDSIRKNETVPPVVFTDFLVFNKPVTSFGKDSPLKKHISVLGDEEIVLSYKQSVLSFQFAALNYLAPVKNNYRYFLKGFDNEWNEVGHKREATYTNLDPGNYEFYVNASNNDGVWNDKPIKLTLVIIPPYWKTWWFRIVSGLVVFGSILAVYFYRLNAIKRQNSILEEKVKMRTHEILEKNEEIIVQNEELELHRNNLESMVKDRTVELENALQKVEESDRLKTTFLSNISHEIRTPMNAIVGFSGLLNEEGVSYKEREQYIQIVQSNSEYLLKIIDEILDLSLMESNQLNLIKEVFDLNTFIDHIYSYYYLVNKNPKVKIRQNNSLYNLNIKLHTDGTRMKQVITNLMDNALKFTNEGFVELGSHLKNGILSIYVRDTGKGIPEDKIDAIFQVFTKVVDKETDFKRGIGLGLAISKKIVQVMNGKLEVESVYGKGSTFTFSIELNNVIAEQELAIEEIKEPVPTEWQGKTILIAEDVSANYFYLEQVLKKTKANIIWAKNGAEAYQKASEDTKIDLILMDIKMPIMDGKESARKIKEHFPDMKIVAQTAYARPREKEIFYNEDFDAYLTKPIAATNLLKVLERFL